MEILTPLRGEETEERKRDDERQARERRERSTSPLDRSHKSRPSQDRATTASRNDEVSGLEVEMEKPDGMMEKQVRPYITLWILAAPTRLTSMFLIFHIYCAGTFNRKHYHVVGILQSTKVATKMVTLFRSVKKQQTLQEMSQA
ncbi:hypothetical protein F2Q69_00037785 [Brassica cretica]|uniref:Uncharacterized protein n=1 Tax=Brassica cretica TaxID=69181 RepID=A0A8S9SI70_BRACR|nr:hypothetical protein F2Q69_00037785 [Brassica cretica]